MRQDPNVLDTWFSTGRWPLSAFSWQDQTDALKTFYPNSVMKTGFDILFFWVARMAMLGVHFMGEVPFRVVYLTATVRDEKGEKMSKTRGNVIDPLDVTDKHGADALRMTLASMAGQGRDIKLSTERIAGYRAFANKIWNAARFVLMNANGYDPDHPAQPASVYDRWGKGYQVDPVAEREMDLVARAIEGARSVRGEVNLPPNQPVPIVLLPRDAGVQRTFRDHEPAFRKLANASRVTVLAPRAKRPANAAVHVEAEVEVHLPLRGLIDFGGGEGRAEKEPRDREAELPRIAKRLA